MKREISKTQIRMKISYEGSIDDLSNEDKFMIVFVYCR